MRIKGKIICIIVAAFAANLILLMGYYNLFMSKQVAQDFRAMQEQVDQQTIQLAQELEQAGNWKVHVAPDTKTGILIEDLTGYILFSAQPEEHAALTVNSAQPVRIDGQDCLLRVSRQIPVDNVWKISAAKYLFGGELGILFVLLVTITLLIYRFYVRPLENLQKSMVRYKSGEKATPIMRKDEIGQLQNAFVKLTEMIQEEQQQQNRIIASISHDIKTPLTSVMGYAERLQSGKLSPERQKKYIHTIYEKATSIGDLIQEFDDYLGSHLQGALKKQVISLKSLRDIIYSDYKEELEGVGVHLVLPEQIPDGEIQVDVAKIRRVFGNMIANSLKHGKAKTIRIEMRIQDENALIQVSDDGVGVPQEMIGKIFDPLFTSDEGRSVAGLGLSICKEIVEAHGGRIEALRHREGGLAITISLPCRERTLTGK